MSAPLRRVRDPQPVGRGWEMALIATTVALGLLVGAAFVGVGAAAAIWGDGWVWPATARDIAPAVVGLVQGHLGAGYPETQLARIAGPVPTYAVVIICEAVLISTGVVAGSAVVRLSRAARSGMATRRQAEQALGASGLRAAAPVIRPDLHRH